MMILICLRLFCRWQNEAKALAKTLPFITVPKKDYMAL
jgi:hypothetical protein